MTRDLRNTIKRTGTGIVSSWFYSIIIIVVFVVVTWKTKQYWDHYKDPNSLDSYFKDVMNKRDFGHRFIDWIREEP